MTIDLKIRKCVNNNAEIPASERASAIKHAYALLNRYINANEVMGIDPTSIDKVIEESVEDYLLEKKTGKSVLDPIPDISESEFSKYTFHQYTSPKIFK